MPNKVFPRIFWPSFINWRQKIILLSLFRSHKSYLGIVGDQRFDTTKRENSICPQNLWCLFAAISRPKMTMVNTLEDSGSSDLTHDRWMKGRACPCTQQLQYENLLMKKRSLGAEVSAKFVTSWLVTSMKFLDIPNYKKDLCTKLKTYISQGCKWMKSWKPLEIANKMCVFKITRFDRKPFIITSSGWASAATIDQRQLLKWLIRGSYS